MKIKHVHVPLSSMSYPMLRLLLDCHLEHWTELTGDGDIYHVDQRIKQQAELLSDIFNEFARRI